MKSLFLEGYSPNSDLDLMLERVVAVPREFIWKAWTDPQHLMPWFCPKPWSVTDCEIDLRPGGRFMTQMQSPEGEKFPNEGCFLEIIEPELLVWTDALGPGFRPSEKPFFTAAIHLTPQGSGTLYQAIAIHGNPANRQKHEEMGFTDGWGKCLDQLVEYIQTHLM